VCQVSNGIRRRAYRTESVATVMTRAAAQIPNSEAGTPARLRNVRGADAPSSRA
jgi:hypothetical protein